MPLKTLIPRNPATCCTHIRGLSVFPSILSAVAVFWPFPSHCHPAEEEGWRDVAWPLTKDARSLFLHAASAFRSTPRAFSTQSALSTAAHGTREHSLSPQPFLPSLRTPAPYYGHKTTLFVICATDRVHLFRIPLCFSSPQELGCGCHCGSCSPESHSIARGSSRVSAGLEQPTPTWMRDSSLLQLPHPSLRPAASCAPLPLCSAHPPPVVPPTHLASLSPSLSKVTKQAIALITLALVARFLYDNLDALTQLLAILSGEQSFKLF